MKPYTEPPYYSHRLVKFKLHIDHIDNDDQRIWAIDIQNGPYLTAKLVLLKGNFKLSGNKVRKAQPRAYLTGKGFIGQNSTDLITIIGVDL